MIALVLMSSAYAAPATASTAKPAAASTATTAAATGPAPISAADSAQVAKLLQEYKQRNDWAVANPDVAKELGYTYQAPSSFTFYSMGIKEVYTTGATHLRLDKPLTEDQKLAGTIGLGAAAGGAVDCAGLHPANPECCGYEYYKEWGSACGIPGTLETFDELKESACLAAQNANSVSDFEKAATEAAQTPVQCKSLFNAVAGFCEPGSGQPVGDIIATGIAMDKGYFEGLAAPDKNQVYIRLEPTGKENADWMIVRGYIVSTVKRQQVANDPKAATQIAKEAAKTTELRQDKQTAKPDQFYLNAELQFVPDLDAQANLAPYFKETEATRNLQAGTLPPGFADALCAHAIAEKAAECKSAIAPKIYTDIKGRIGVTDQVYIVRPDRDGMLRSVQCLCLPAVTGYLTYWKNILTAVKQCFQSIRETGEARPGVCQAVLSRYVCDMLYDVLTCFTNKYNVPGQGTSFSGTGGIGDVMGALSKAGNDMQQGITSRYGQTSLYNTMFVERKLLHSICSFAFTGTWDLDVAGMYKQTIEEMPLKTQGFVYPAERRFISFNPVTKPAGLPTFMYHFGVGLAAGSDIRYQLDLVCSNSARCKTSDGFEQGKCDCFGRTERRQIVSSPKLSGSLKKGEILDQEVFYSVQGGDPASAVRYDTAILSWETMDVSGVIDHQEQKFAISSVGERPPNFCRFDPLSVSYRCDLGIGDYSGGRLTTVAPLYPAGQTYFKLGDPIRFQATVLMKVPESAKTQAGCIGVCPWTKWLNYNISNQYGGELVTGVSANDMPQRSDLKFEADGEDQRIVQVRVGGVDWKLDTPNFAQTTKQAETRVDVGDGWMAGVADVTYAGSLPFNAVLVIKPKDKTNAYPVELYETSGRVSSAVRTAQNIIFDRGTTHGTDTVTQVGTQVNVFKTTYQGAIKVTIFNGKGDFTQPLEFMLKTQAQTPAGQDYCSSPGLLTWNALFTLHDSTQVAGGSAYEYNPVQLTYDPNSQDMQQVTVPFNVICSKTGPTGVAAGVRACTADATQPQAYQCFCGSAAELADANARYAANTADTTILNCGPGNLVNLGNNYCIYKDTANPTAGRTCSALGGSQPSGVATGAGAAGGTTSTGTSTGISPNIKSFTIQGSGDTETACIVCDIPDESVKAKIAAQTFYVQPGQVSAAAEFVVPHDTIPVFQDTVNGQTLQAQSIGEEGDVYKATATFTVKLSSAGTPTTLSFTARDSSGKIIATTPTGKIQVQWPASVTYAPSCDDACRKPYTDKLTSLGAKYQVKEQADLPSQLQIRIGGTLCPDCVNLDTLESTYKAYIASIPSQFT
jgi:hypothetical protein